MKKTSPMELTTLLNRTKFSVSKLTPNEHRFLSFLLARVNKDKLSTHGYLAWPGTDEIIEYTGLSKPTIERLRKSLVAAGWMQYTPGHGAGSSNHYYINGERIVSAYAETVGKPFDGEPYATNVQERPKKAHKRNTEGLKKGKTAPEPTKLVAPPSKPKELEAFDGEFPRYYFGKLVRNSNELRQAELDKYLEDNNLESPF
jgi:DNA-binding MarR family transcriptional regulator